MEGLGGARRGLAGSEWQERKGSGADRTGPARQERKGVERMGPARRGAAGTTRNNMAITIYTAARQTRLPHTMLRRACASGDLPCEDRGAAMHPRFLLVKEAVDEWVARVRPTWRSRSARTDVRRWTDRERAMCAEIDEEHEYTIDAAQAAAQRTGRSVEACKHMILRLRKATT